MPYWNHAAIEVETRTTPLPREVSVSAMASDLGNEAKQCKASFCVLPGAYLHEDLQTNTAPLRAAVSQLSESGSGMEQRKASFCWQSDLHSHDDGCMLRLAEMPAVDVQILMKPSPSTTMLSEPGSDVNSDIHAQVEQAIIVCETAESDVQADSPLSTPAGTETESMNDTDSEVAYLGLVRAVVMRIPPKAAHPWMCP